MSAGEDSDRTPAVRWPRLLRGNVRPLAAGLATIAAFAFVGWLCLEGIVRLVVGSSSWSVDQPYGTLTATVVVMIAVAVVLGSVFVAGLVDMLVQSGRGGGRGDLGRAFATYRRAHWLWLALLIAAPVVAVVAFVTAGAMIFAPLVLAIGEGVLVFGVFTAPLILDRRLDTFRALSESSRLVRRDGFAAHVARLFILTVVGIVFWWLVAKGLFAIGGGEYEWTPQFSDPTTWLVVAGEGFWGSFVRTLLISLVGAAGVAATCGAIVVFVAANYSRATRGTAARAASVATRPWRRRSLVTTMLLLLIGLTWFVWWFATPPASRMMSAGERVTLRNGLTFTVPAGSVTELDWARKYPSWLGLGDNGGTPVATFFGPLSDFVARDGGAFFAMSISPDSDPSPSAWSPSYPWGSPVVGRSVDGTVEIRWERGTRRAYVVTHVPGKLNGLVQIRLTSSWSDRRPMGPGQAMQSLAAVWSTWSVQGAPLPAQTAWRSQQVAPGRRTVLASGLSVVMPHGWTAELASSSTSNLPAESFMPAMLEPAALWYAEVVSLRSSTDEQLKWLHDTSSMRLVARSADDLVDVYGPADNTHGTLAIVTHLRGRSIGLLTGRFDDEHGYQTKEGVLQDAARLWQLYQVKGATLPTLPTE
jgi:hypothetical protein